MSLGIQGTLYLTEGELETFQVHYSERDESFYIPKEDGPGDVGGVRPLITENVPPLHAYYLLEYQDYTDEDWTDLEHVAKYEHYDDPERGCEVTDRLRIKVVDTDQYAAQLDDLVKKMANAGLPAEAASAILKQKAREVKP